MTQQTINTGTASNSRDGDPLRTAFTKINANFTELYSTVYPGIPGPYANDSAAAGAGVSIGKPYYQTSGQVFVRLT